MTEQARRPLPLTELTAITILDGRNRKDVVELAPYVSEFNIIRTRIEVEAKFLIALSDIGVLRPVTDGERNKLNSFGENISLEDAEKIKQIEEETNHDVKAMERAFRTMLTGTSLEDLTESVHLAITSEDPNNLTYRLILKRATDDVLVPNLDRDIDEIVDVAEKEKATPIIARTHGQAATPTTFGHEMAVFATRLNREVRALEARTLRGKLNGAVGGFNALHDSFPDVDWIKFSEKFVKSLGFEPNLVTTQINPYEDMIEDFQNLIRINSILIDFDQDIWRYISDHWLALEVKKAEVGSSTMPQKVNPIKSENSEGNLGKANALLEFFSRKLAISRLQRDLSDSTVIRDMGAPLGYSLLGYKNALDGLKRTRTNKTVMSDALNADWSILSEAAQTRMRTYGIEDPYTIMKNLVRGTNMSQKDWLEVIDQLPITDEQKISLKELTPETYIGLAVEITEMAIQEIRDSRKAA